MSDLIIGKDSTGLKHPVLVDGNGAVVISGTVSSVGNVETILNNSLAVETVMAADLAITKGYTLVTKGSGVVDSNTQRVTLATDGPEVTNSTAIKNSVAAIPAKGAATTANSTPVNIASDQTVPVRLATGTASIGYLTAPSTFSAGQQTVTATAAALPSGTLTNGVVLTNSSSAVVYIGNTGVTSSTGYALPVGASIGLTVASLSSVFIVGTASSGSLSYLGS